MALWAVAQHSTSKRGSAFALHHNCNKVAKPDGKSRISHQDAASIAPRKSTKGNGQILTFKFILIMAVRKIALGINLRKNKIIGNAGFGKYYPEVDRQAPLSLRRFAQHMVDMILCSFGFVIRTNRFSRLGMKNQYRLNETSRLFFLTPPETSFSSLSEISSLSTSTSGFLTFSSSSSLTTFLLFSSAIISIINVNLCKCKVLWLSQKLQETCLLVLSSCSATLKISKNNRVRRYYSFKVTSP